MLAEPGQGGGAGGVEALDVSVEVAAGQDLQALGLQGLFVGGDGEPGRDEGVVQGGISNSGVGLIWAM